MRLKNFKKGKFKEKEYLLDLTDFQRPQDLDIITEELTFLQPLLSDIKKAYVVNGDIYLYLSDNITRLEEIISMVFNSI